MRTGPAAVTPFIPSDSPGEAVIGSVTMDDPTVDWTLQACAAAEPRLVGEALTNARVTVRALGVHALPSAHSAMWHSAVVNRQVKLAHSDADPTAAAPVARASFIDSAKMAVVGPHASIDDRVLRLSVEGSTMVGVPSRVSAFQASTRVTKEGVLVRT